MPARKSKQQKAGTSAASKAQAVKQSRHVESLSQRLLPLPCDVHPVIKSEVESTNSAAVVLDLLEVKNLVDAEEFNLPGWAELSGQLHAASTSWEGDMSLSQYPPPTSPSAHLNGSYILGTAQSRATTPAMAGRSARQAIRDADMANITKIPLVCYLCPQVPTFSDVSHLLTHISSKSHLANRFKSEFTSKTDLARKVAVDRYQEWYEAFDIEKHLAGRLAAKEAQKSRAAPPRPRRTNKRPRSPDTLDDLHSISDGEYQCNQSVQEAPMHTFMHGHARRTRSQVKPSQYSARHDPNSSVSESSEMSSSVGFDDSQSATDLTQMTASSVEDVSSEEAAKLQAKLKGTVWPGMQIFDAATPEQRKKRNQKKDGSILQNMIITSGAVEQTEMVWDQKFWSVTRIRNVYDEPSLDGSDISVDDYDEIKTKRLAKASRSSKTVALRKPRVVSKASTRGGKRRTPRTPKSPGGKRVTRAAAAPKLSQNQWSRGSNRRVSRLAVEDSEEYVPSDPELLHVLQNAASFEENSVVSGDQQGVLFNHTSRPALRPLSVNTAIMSPTPVPKAHTGTGYPYSGSGTSFYPGCNAQGQVDACDAFSHHHIASPSHGLNPLCLQQPETQTYLYNGSPIDDSLAASSMLYNSSGLSHFGMSSNAYLYQGLPNDASDYNLWADHNSNN